jgi:hypothetical protein
VQEQEVGQSDDGIRDVDLPVARLLLDEGNFRIEEVDNQLDAIYEVLRQQREGEKILNLAKDIVARGRLAPGERLMVVADDDLPTNSEDEEERFVVMEGNRRITALKLLDNPELIKDEFPKLYQQFVQLATSAPRRLLANVPCVVLKDKETALDWVELKHSTNLDGTGLEKWDATATARFAERKGRFRRWRIALKRLIAAGVDTTDIERGIAKKTTAVERVLGSRVVRDSLGLIFLDNQGSVEFENRDDVAGVALLLRLLRVMADPGFSTAKVHSLEDRTEFILTFENLAVKIGETNDQEYETKGKGREESTSPTEEQGTGKQQEGSETPGQAPAGGTRPSGGLGTTKTRGKHPLRVDRKSLAPTKRELTFHVKDPALNKLYNELRELPVKRFPRVSGVLARVFLEMSCDAYLEGLNLPLPEHFARKNVTRWADAKMKEKVEAVLKDLDPSRQNMGLEFVRKALGGDDWLHSIDTLHVYVHNRLADISDQEVRTIWDRYQPLFMGIYERLTKA